MDSSILFQKYYNKALYFLSPRPRSEKEIRDNLLRHSGKRSVSRIRLIERSWTSPSASDIRLSSGQALRAGQDDKQARMRIIEQVIDKLKEQNFINDEEFAKWWVEQRTVFRPRGVRLIKLELRQKGISQEIIESQISNFQFQISNERERARKLVQKRLERYKNVPKIELYQKLQRFLAARGFDFDVISDVLKDINNR